MSAPPTHDASTRPGPLPVLTLMALLLLVAVAALAAGATIGEGTTIDEPVEWTDAEYTVTANVTVTAGGVLSITADVLTFDSPDGGAIGIEVQEGGLLEVDGTDFGSDGHRYFIKVRGEAVFTGASLSDPFGPLSAFGKAPLLDGGIVVASGDLVLEDVMLEGKGILLSAEGGELSADGLTISGADRGMVLTNTTGTLRDVRVSDTLVAFTLMGCQLALEDVEAEDVNWTMWATMCDITVDRLVSRPVWGHLSFENGTSLVRDSEFHLGEEGALAFLGFMEVRRCAFYNTTTAVAIHYAEGRLVDTIIEGSVGVSITLSFVGFASEEPVFELDNVTVREGRDAAVEVESSDLTLSNLTVEDCADGVVVSTSEVLLRDSRISGTTPCQSYGCSVDSTGTGIMAESALLILENVTVEGSHGPAVGAYFSIINATGCRFVDGDVSGIVMTYGDLHMATSEVSGNGLWGVESLGWPITPEELDANWGNGLADIRENMTVNVKVLDQTGKWLSHAQVQASSTGLVYGPYTTGFGGSTPTLELPVKEWTDGDGVLDFNPWTLDVTYGEFTNSTEVTVQIGVPQLTLYITVPRADLVVESIRAPREMPVEESAVIRATVTNIGNHTSAGAVLTFYYRTQEGFQRVIDEVDVDPMEPGETFEASVEWSPIDTGRFTLVAQVDVDDLVDEEVEDNNRLERETRVQRSEDGGIPGPGALMALVAVGLAASLMAVLSHRGRHAFPPGRA